MNLGTENRKKTMIAGALGMVAVICIGFLANTLFGGSDAPTPPPAVAPVTKPAIVPGVNAPITPQTSATNSNGDPKTALMPTGNAAGAPARQVASASASLDPSLDETAMLRTEALVYSGSGRNIFSLLYVPPPPSLPAPIKVRPCPPNCPPPPRPPPPPPPPPTCPPTCPPIPLKFFGTETLANGTRQAFLLQGDDVFLAAVGDIVARKYKIVSIGTNSIQVEDLGNTNTQTLLQSN